MKILIFLITASCASPPPLALRVTIDPPSADATGRCRRDMDLLVRHALHRNDPPPGCSSWAACTPEEVRVLARVEWDAGTALYAAGDYRSAYRRFKTAYLATHDPALLANMAFALAHFDRWSAYWFLLEYLVEDPDRETSPQCAVAEAADWTAADPPIVCSGGELPDRVALIRLATRLRDAADWETQVMQREPYPRYESAFVGPLPEGADRGTP